MALEPREYHLVGASLDGDAVEVMWLCPLGGPDGEAKWPTTQTYAGIVDAAGAEALWATLKADLLASLGAVSESADDIRGADIRDGRIDVKRAFLRYAPEATVRSRYANVRDKVAPIIGRTVVV